MYAEQRYKISVQTNKTFFNQSLERSVTASTSDCHRQAIPSMRANEGKGFLSHGQSLQYRPNAIRIPSDIKKNHAQLQNDLYA